MDLPIQKYGKTERRKFGSINEVIDIPDLVEIQKDSYNAFIEDGISEVFEDFSPITDYSDHFELYFLEHRFGDKPKYDEKECRTRDATYALPLRVKVRLVNKVKNEVVDQEVFMGDLPLMTETAHSSSTVQNVLSYPSSFVRPAFITRRARTRLVRKCSQRPLCLTVALGLNLNRTRRTRFMYV